MDKQEKCNQQSSKRKSKIFDYCTKIYSTPKIVTV
jgi:hypothetical protein